MSCKFESMPDVVPGERERPPSCLGRAFKVQNPELLFHTGVDARGTKCDACLNEVRRNSEEM